MGGTRRGERGETRRGERGEMGEIEFFCSQLDVENISPNFTFGQLFI